MPPLAYVASLLLPRALAKLNSGKDQHTLYALYWPVRFMSLSAMWKLYGIIYRNRFRKTKLSYFLVSIMLIEGVGGWK